MVLKIHKWIIAGILTIILAVLMGIALWLDKRQQTYSFPSVEKTISLEESDQHLWRETLYAKSEILKEI